MARASYMPTRSCAALPAVAALVAVMPCGARAQTEATCAVMNGACISQEACNAAQMFLGGTWTWTAGWCPSFPWNIRCCCWAFPVSKDPRCADSATDPAADSAADSAAHPAADSTTAIGIGHELFDC
eukprot:gene15878-19107_t